MPFTDDIPAENTDPWYSGLLAAWASLKTFVNGLETSLATKVNSSTYTAGLANKADLVSGKVPTSQLPALAINETFTVNSQAAMLALAASQGDVAVRTDTSEQYFLAAEPASTLGNWALMTGTGVTSVAGKTGVVSLVKGDVGLGSVDNTADTAKPVSTAQQTALNLKANLASPGFSGTPTVPTPGTSNNSTQAANTAFVRAAISTYAPTGSGNGFLSYDATADTWPSAPAVTYPVMWVSTNDATAVQPPGMKSGDMWIRHPDALGIG